MKKLILPAAFSLLVGCGTKSERSLLNDADRGQALTDLGFLDWCNEWQLGCVGPIDVPPEEFSKPRFDAGVELAEALTHTPSQVNLTLEDTRSPHLAAALASLGLTDFFQPFFSVLATTGWQNAAMAEGKFMARFTSPTTYRSPSNLGVELAAEVVVDFSTSPALAFSGVKLKSSDDSAVQSLQKFGYADERTFNWEGEALRVTGMPYTFLPKQVGLDPDKLVTPTQRQMLTSMGDTAVWLAGTGNEIKLDEAFMQTLLVRLPIFLEEAADRDNAEVFVANAESVVAAPLDQTRLKFLADLKGSTQIKCESNGNSNSEIEFKNEFGAESIAKLRDGATRFTFFGIKVKSNIFGRIGVGFNLKRVDVYQDKAVIRDIPIIGSFTIRFDETYLSEGEEFHCR